MMRSSMGIASPSPTHVARPRFRRKGELYDDRGLLDRRHLTLISESVGAKASVITGTSPSGTIFE
jgi:hypothetical protein